jgi:hypothetical protein
MHLTWHIRPVRWGHFILIAEFLVWTWKLDVATKCGTEPQRKSGGGRERKGKREEEVKNIYGKSIHVDGRVSEENVAAIHHVERAS